jgi:formate-dependent nitrite reductase cytochrome c552 subunit
MFSVFSRPAGVAALSIVVLGMAACGESSEEKANKQVCAATSEISSQVKKLEALPISSSFPAEVKSSAEAIDKSLGEIKSAAPNLETARKEEFEAATKTFQLELASLLATTVSGAASGEAALKSAEPKLKASLSKLGTDYKQAFEALKCS